MTWSRVTLICAVLVLGALAGWRSMGAPGPAGEAPEIETIRRGIEVGQPLQRVDAHLRLTLYTLRGRGISGYRVDQFQVRFTLEDEEYEVEELLVHSEGVPPLEPSEPLLAVPCDLQYVGGIYRHYVPPVPGLQGRGVGLLTADPARVVGTNFCGPADLWGGFADMPPLFATDLGAIPTGPDKLRGHPSVSYLGVRDFASHPCHVVRCEWPTNQAVQEWWVDADRGFSVLYYSHDFVADAEQYHDARVVDRLDQLAGRWVPGRFRRLTTVKAAGVTTWSMIKLWETLDVAADYEVPPSRVPHRFPLRTSIMDETTGSAGKQGGLFGVPPPPPPETLLQDRPMGGT